MRCSAPQWPTFPSLPFSFASVKCRLLEASACSFTPHSGCDPPCATMIQIIAFNLFKKQALKYSCLDKIHWEEALKICPSQESRCVSVYWPCEEQCWGDGHSLRGTFLKLYFFLLFFFLTFAVFCTLWQPAELHWCWLAEPIEILRKYFS